MNNLALLYYFGKGIEKNLEKALYWFQKAAENGEKDAMINLALLYCSEGTEKNLEKAFYWFQKAAAEHGK
jgi:TPR repeat protein